MSMPPEERRASRRHETQMHRSRHEMRLLRSRARRREGADADGPLWQRAYIGMGVYIECDGDEVRLSTLNDFYEDEIYLEPDALAALVLFAKRCGIEAAR